ncbi:MAG: glycosyltransferase family A protein [Vicinamibacterales bacterium]
MPEPRLSVIIATYNRASLLPGCIGSLRAAGVPDLRIIVVDDGSQDDTGEVVRSLGDDIEYIRQANGGDCAARNTGIQAATTPYVAYLDSDDFWLPGVATTLLDMLDRHPRIGAIFTDAQVGNPAEGYHSWKASAGTDAFDRIPYEEVEPRLRLLDSDALFRLMIRRNAVFTGAIVQRRQLLLDAGLFDGTLRGTGDWELWLRLIPLMPFAWWPDPLAIYTRHDDNLTNNQDRMQLAFCQALIHYRAKNGDWYRRYRAEVDEALRNHLFFYGWSAYERREYDVARDRFKEGLRHMPDDRRLRRYWTATSLPAPVLNAARRVKGLLAS